MRSIIACLVLLLAACGSADKWETRVELARDADLAIVRGGSSDTWGDIADAYLGSKTKQWVLTAANPGMASPAGREVVVPLTPFNPVGVYPDGYQTVPVLCYHRFTNGAENGKLVLNSERFEQQMTYLADNGYHVISFADLRGFIEGNEPVPPRSVILTIDDGYRSTYEIAYPILRRFGFPATVFVYTDFIGAPAALTWPQLRDMIGSGLIDVQPHSKSHSNLVLIGKESTGNHRQVLLQEVVHSSNYLRRRLDTPMHTFSYPYGATNDAVVKMVRQADLALAATVHRGANPSFASPYRLKRAQIYSTFDLDTFAKQLTVFKQADLR